MNYYDSIIDEKDLKPLVATKVFTLIVNEYPDTDYSQDANIN